MSYQSNITFENLNFTKKKNAFESVELNLHGVDLNKT